MKKNSDEEFNLDEFDKFCEDFDRMSSEIDILAQEVDSDCSALSEAMSEYDKIKDLKQQLEDNPESTEAAQIKGKIKYLEEKNDGLLKNIKPVDKV